MGVVRVTVDDDLALVLPVYAADLLAKIALQALHAGTQAGELVLEAEHGLDAGEVEAELTREPVDEPQPLEIGVGVEAGITRRAHRLHEPLGLVDAERLRVHPDELGGDGDHVARAIVHQLTPSRSLGFARETFWRFSIASRSAFVSFVGTTTRTRARRSPRPEPFSFGAPRPRTRRSLASCVPGGTLSEMRPSGVGTSTSAPSAASA